MEQVFYKFSQFLAKIVGSVCRHKHNIGCFIHFPTHLVNYQVLYGKVVEIFSTPNYFMSFL